MSEYSYGTVLNTLNFEGDETVMSVDVNEGGAECFRFYSKADVDSIEYIGHKKYLPKKIMELKDALMCNENDVINIIDEVHNPETLVTTFFIDQILNNSMVKEYSRLSSRDIDDILNKYNLNEIIESSYGNYSELKEEEVVQVQNCIYTLLKDAFENEMVVENEEEDKIDNDFENE